MYVIIMLPCSRKTIFQHMYGPVNFCILYSVTQSHMAMQTVVFLFTEMNYLPANFTWQNIAAYENCPHLEALPGIRSEFFIWVKLSVSRRQSKDKNNSNQTTYIVY